MSNHAITIDEDHFQQWLHIMRTTSAPQVKGKLCAQPPKNPEVKGFCCLGLGSTLVEGVTIERALSIDDAGGEVPDDYYYVFGADDLAPAEFIDWLTGERGWSGDSHDVVPDFPADLRVQGRKAHGMNAAALHRTSLAPLTDAASAANMNDGGMSFAQIADTFAYFGVGAIRS